MKNKKMIIIFMIFTVFIISSIFVSYGYVISKVEGNSLTKSFNSISKILKIKYSDGTNVITSNQNNFFIPGSYLTKNFTVQNIGNVPIYYSVNLTNIINDFSRKEDLIYELYLNDSLIVSDILPSNNLTIAYNQKCDIGKELNYTLKIIYKESEENQIIDQGKSISVNLDFEKQETIINNIQILGNTIQNGIPSLDNPAEIISVGDKTSNIFNTSIITAGDFKLGNSLSNNYGTTVNSNEYTGEIVVTQKKYPNPNEDTAYQNGFFSMGLSGLEVGKKYTLIYDFDVLSNPLNIDSASQLIIHKSQYLYPIIENNRAKVTFEWQDDTYNSIEFRLAGRSMKYKNFMLVEGEVEGFPEYEPKDKYKIPLTISGNNIINVDNLNFFDKQLDGSYLSNVNVSQDYTLIENLKGTYTFSIKIKSPLDSNYRLIVEYIDGTNSQQYKNSTGDYVDFSFTTNGKDIKRVYFTYNILSNKVVFKEFQIEKGDNRTSYKEFVEPTTYNIYLDEPLGKINDYTDYLSFKDKKVYRTTYETEILSSWNWSNYTNFMVHENKLPFKGLSTYSVLNNITNSMYTVSFSNATLLQLQVKYSDLGVTNIDDAKNKLLELENNGTPLKVYYPTVLREENISEHLFNIYEISPEAMITIGTAIQPTIEIS